MAATCFQVRKITFFQKTEFTQTGDSDRNDSPTFFLRARQLVEDHGFTILQLQKFFARKRFETPFEYASLSRTELEDKMLKAKVTW